MDALEQAAERLRQIGYFASFSWVSDQWHCALYNDRMNAIPVGLGPTLALSLQAAERNKDQLVQQGRQRSTS